MLTAHTVDTPAQTINACISAIFPARDATAHTAVVEARVANPGYRLKPGQYLAVSLPLGDAQRKILTVPTSALMVRDGQASLFLAQSDGLRLLAQRVNVETGQQSNDVRRLSAASRKAIKSSSPAWPICMTATP